MNGHANGSAKKGGVAKAKKFDFKPVNHAEFAQKGMALYRAPSLLQPHRVRSFLCFYITNFSKDPEFFQLT